MFIKPTLLIIDDDIELLRLLNITLKSNFDVMTANNTTSAQKNIKISHPDVVLLDIHLNDPQHPETTGITFLKEILRHSPDIRVVMMSADNDETTITTCMRMGAIDFIVKPFTTEQIQIRLNKVIQENLRNVVLQERLRQFEHCDLIGNAPQMHKVKEAINAVTQDRHMPVLIRGEAGTGKEVVARVIHQKGQRNHENIVTVNIVSLSENLAEAELFGYEKGAFTGAIRRHIGYFEQANRGVLFLDEIGELPDRLQAKLLRFLQDHIITRLGSTTSIEVDTQLIMATNRNLEQALREKQIREDFYYRITHFEIFLPPLRERRDDIPLLVSYLLKRFRDQGRTKITNVSPEVMRVFISYEWPGNIRELENVLERAIIYANYFQHSQIELDDTTFKSNLIQVNHPLHTVDSLPKTISPEGIDLDREIANLTLQYIEQALRTTNGGKAEAAVLLKFHDRFAMLRRIKTLQHDYSDLFARYPYLCQLYPLSTTNEQK